MDGMPRVYDNNVTMEEAELLIGHFAEKNCFDYDKEINKEKFERIINLCRKGFLRLECCPKGENGKSNGAMRTKLTGCGEIELILLRKENKIFDKISQ